MGVEDNGVVGQDGRVGPIDVAVEGQEWPVNKGEVPEMGNREPLFGSHKRLESSWGG